MIFVGYSQPKRKIFHTLNKPLEISRAAMPWIKNSDILQKRRVSLYALLWADTSKGSV